MAFWRIDFLIKRIPRVKPLAIIQLGIPNCHNQLAKEKGEEEGKGEREKEGKRDREEEEERGKGKGGEEGRKGKKRNKGRKTNIHAVNYFRSELVKGRKRRIQNETGNIARMFGSVNEGSGGSHASTPQCNARYNFTF